MNAPMHAGRLCGAALLTVSAALTLAAQEPPPPPSAARILLLPRQAVSGDRATLAVLDIQGRLTPNVTVHFSNGDKYKTDATGRALFVAPLKTGVIFGSLEGRPGHVPLTILRPKAAAAASMEILAVPNAASVSDRFELRGRDFCGTADQNRVEIGARHALVLAASPVSLVILPPPDLSPGVSLVDVSCGKKAAPQFRMLFVSLELEADGSPLAPGEHRQLTVHVRGTSGKVAMEARNLAPDVAELTGGTTVRAVSSGGALNTAQFEVTGKKRGNFLISIRLRTGTGPPHD